MVAELVIRVRIEQIEMGFLSASSVDLPGMFVNARTMREIFEHVPIAIRTLLSHKGVECRVGEPELVAESTYLWRVCELPQSLRKTG